MKILKFICSVWLAVYWLWDAAELVAAIAVDDDESFVFTCCLWNEYDNG